MSLQESRATCHSMTTDLSTCPLGTFERLPTRSLSQAMVCKSPASTATVFNAAANRKSTSSDKLLTLILNAIDLYSIVISRFSTKLSMPRRPWTPRSAFFLDAARSFAETLGFLRSSSMSAWSAFFTMLAKTWSTAKPNTCLPRLLELTAFINSASTSNLGSLRYGHRPHGHRG